jgi:hypothetical protein
MRSAAARRILPLLPAAACCMMAGWLAMMSRKAARWSGWNLSAKSRTGLNPIAWLCASLLRPTPAAGVLVMAFTVALALDLKLHD